MEGKHRPSVVVIALITTVILAASDWVSPVESSFLRFKPDTEYIYTFRSSTSLKNVRTLHAESKVGFVAVKPSNDADYQEVYLRVHSVALTSDEKPVSLEEGRDFSDWFSFEIGASGRIGHVHYPRDEDKHVIFAKKGMAGLLASNLQHSSKGKYNQNSWSYDCNETGHEGLHEASYTAQTAPGSDGIIVFTKKRRTHPIPYGKSKHQKEIHYHPVMQLPTIVKILDHFDAPRESGPGFQRQFPDSEKEADDVVNLPEMQSFSEGQLTFLQEQYYASPSRPTSREDLISDSIEMTALDHHMNYNMALLKEQISGNLTCMRTAPLKGSHQRSHCFQMLVDNLLSVPDSQKLAKLVSPKYKLPLSRQTCDKEDRLNLLDAVAAMHTDASQSLLADLILLSPRPTKELVERLLIASAGFKETVSQHYLTTVEDIVFQSWKFSEPLCDREIQRVAVLVLGALAGHQWEAGHNVRAESIVMKIEDRLGVHDPWTYDKTMKSLSEDEQEEFHHDTVAWIEALGNAGLHRSFPHIQSYTNSSTTHPMLKRAGLHSMRDYHHDKAAQLLLKSALDEDEDEHVRYEASLLFRNHPHGSHQNISKFVTPDEYTSVAANLHVSEEVSPTEVASVPSRNRVRRGFWEGLEFKLASPSINWGKLIGNARHVGGEFGVTIRNELNVKIAPLSGHLIVDLFDEAYATVLIGLVNFKLDVIRARFCFNRQIKYNINILQEFGVERFSDIAKVYDLIVGRVIGNIRKAVDIVVGLFNGDLNISQLFDNFVQALQEIPERISTVRSVAAEAVARLSRFDPDQLPPSFRGVLTVVNKAAQLLSDMKTDIMEFYQAVNEAITVTLPTAADKIWKAIVAVADSIDQLLKSPLKAISKIFKGVLNIKFAVDSILSAKKEVEEANFLKEGQRPYWFDLPKVIGNILRELRYHLSNITHDLTTWINAVKSSEDSVKKLTGGALDSHTLRKRVQTEIESVFEDVMAPIEPISDLLEPFFKLYNLVFGAVDAIKEAYQTLKTGYQKSQALIIKLFGPKAHEKFPRKYREPGSGACAAGGFYPTDSDSYYKDVGVDLEMSPGALLVAPFSGLIYKSPGKHNQLTLEPGGGVFLNIKIFIDNVVPNSTLSETEAEYVIAGTVIGTVDRSATCTPSNYIHMSMKNYKPNRLASLLDDFFGDANSTAANLAAREGYVDPGNYLAKRPLEIPRWQQGCDEYKLVWLGKTVKEGSLFGGKKEGNTTDTTPERKANPDTNTDRPDPSRMPPKRTYPISHAVSEENRQTTKEALNLPDQKVGSGSPFKDFSLRNLKIGSILAFARKIGLDETADALLRVVGTIVKLVSNKPCVIPESMTNDALRIELQQRGLSAQGDREALLRQYKQPDDRCPLLQVTLPKNIYCRFDESCLGVECCMQLKLFMVSVAFKAFMRFDPCEFQFVLGVNSWNYTLHILDAEFGREWDVPLPFDIPIVSDMKLHLRFTIEKSNTQLLASMSVGFCPAVGDTDCLPFIDILQDSAVPLPICHPNGTLTWPDINIKEYFSRANLKHLIKASGEDLLEQGAEIAWDYVLNKLGIPKELLANKEPCVTPTSLSRTQIVSELEERELDVTGTRTDLEARLSLDDRTCEFITLPAFPPEVAKVAYCSLSENCLRLDCCLQLDVKVVKFRRSFSATFELNACDFMFIIAFQNMQYKTLLLSYDWGQVEQKSLGPITLTYSITKLEVEKEFEVDLRVAICPSGEDCIFDIDIVQDYRVPIPLCNSNFSLSLPGGDTVKEFVTQVGKNAGQQAVNILLEHIGLGDKISDGPCNSTALVPENTDACSAVTLPPLPSSLTCELSHRCLGVRCCVELDLKITILSVKAWLILDPCEFTLSLGLGKWLMMFTLFDYHWGTLEKIRIGKAVSVVYTINKLPEDKVFILDLALSLCLPEFECDTPSIDILRGVRVPIPLCNENATFDLPGDGTVQGFLQMVGQNAAESAVDAILHHLGLSSFISQVPCIRPQVTQNGWKRICPKDVKLPHLPRNLICTLPDACLGFDCCLELPIPGISPVSARFSFIFDPCDFVLSMCLGSWTKDLKIFSYRWGQKEELTVGKPITVSVVIDKLDTKKSFQISLDITFCIDGDCIVTPVLQDSLVPIPLCNLNASLELPGDGSFAGFARDLAGNVGELAIQAGLRKLGIEQYIDNQECDMMVLAPRENGCPLLNAPSPTNILTCFVDDQCLGLTCCTSLDLIFTRLSTTAYAVLDPCEFRLSVGLGSWSRNVTLIDYAWGIERNINISDVVHVTFNIDKLTDQKEFLVDLSLTLCIDGNCKPISLLQQAHIPIPICNPNATLILPGNGTVAGYLADLGGHVTEAAIDLVMEYLGLKNFLSLNPCNLPTALLGSNSSCPVQFPDSFSQLSCRINDPCTSLHCCLNFDLKVTHISSKAWFELNPCDYKLSVGLEAWFFNVSLFSYEWGKMESFAIGSAIEVRFSIEKLDAYKEYEVDLSFSLLIDDITTVFPIMTNERIPIPICNANFSLTLPGDGTVKGFLDELGNNVGQAAIQLVLQKLNLQDLVLGHSCDLNSAAVTASDCPQISLPFVKNIIQCSIEDHCLSIRCCTDLDFIITSLMLSARIQVDPCNFQLYVAFENWERNLTLFSYTWGTVKSVPIGSAITLSYSVDKLSDKKVFSVTLNIGLCVDDVCTTTPVLDHVWIPIPVCNTNATTFSLPGDGTVVGFIQELGGHIGNSAIELVLEKLGLDEYLQSSQCDKGTPGALRSGCPAVDVDQLPDFLSCTVTENCLGIRCCLEMDLKITMRSINAWIILDPCNFNLSIGFEKWEHSVTLFHYTLGEVVDEVVTDALAIRWRLAKIYEDNQFEIDLSLVLCIDGSCNTVTMFEGSRFPIPLCNGLDPYILPGDGTVAGFLTYLGGNVGQFAIDAALHHLNLTKFLTGNACTFPRQDYCSGGTSTLGNCSLIGETCTELRCCQDLHLTVNAQPTIADLSTTAWFKIDPCDFTFTLGLEKWTFHGSVFSYRWGEEMTVPIASGMSLKYSVSKQNDTRAFKLNMNLEYCIEGFCSDFDIEHDLPNLVCNHDFSDYTLSAEGFIETVAGQVIQGASLTLLSRLGVDPDFFSSQPCVNPSGAQSYGTCPNMQLPQNLTSQAHCGISDTCFGVYCCLDVNLGPLHHAFSTSWVIDPCIGQLNLQFENWKYSKSLSHLDFETAKQIQIGNLANFRYNLELEAGEIVFSLSLGVCVDGHCTGEIVLLDSAVSPLPTCYANGTLSWRNLPGVTLISPLGSMNNAGFEVVTRALRLPSHQVSTSPCSPVLPDQSGVCPHLPSLTTLGSGGVCRYSDTCLGVECCLQADLGSISRTVRTWLTVDPCDFRLNVGFENWSYNVTLLSYKWGMVTRERLSEAVLLTFSINKTSDNRNFILSLSLQLCIDGVCAPDITILEDFSAPVPFCNPNGTLAWPQDLDAGGLIINRLGLSSDVLLPQPCSGPPDQITPTTAGCGSLTLPPSAAPFCSLDVSCLEIGCCLTLDLGLVQRSFTVWTRLDPCAQSFSVGFERWSHSEVLAIQLLQSHSSERNIGNIRIRYDVQRPHTSVYDVNLDISLCWEGVCEEPVVVLQDAIFSGSGCGDGSSFRRRRRSIDDLGSQSEEDAYNMNEATDSQVDKARKYFQTLLAKGGTFSADDNARTKLQPEKVVKPRLANSGTASRRSMGLLVFGSEDESSVLRRKRRDIKLSVTLGDESLFDVLLSPDADSGTWQGDIVIGGGLTQKGLEALTGHIANMTIGELEAMLDLQNLDAFTVVQLMKELRDLYRTFVEELTDVITDGKGGDEFKQFDVVLSGTIPFPRRETNFLNQKWGLLVGGFIHLEFTIKAGAFFDLEIPVSVKLISMTAVGGLTPYVGAYARAGVSIGFILYGELELSADIMRTKFPTVAEIVFSKFPLDVGVRMDLDLIPVVIRLKALVTVKVLWWRKTLFKATLWRYEAPAIHKNIFEIHRKKPDKSPPEISEYSTPVETTLLKTSAFYNKCGVEQVPGLDYTEPAFELKVVAADDKSLVTFTYQVGTSPGGNDVVSETEFGGPSTIIPQSLLGGHPLHFTVYARNNGGGTTTATCSMPTFDVTLPTGRITPDFTSTSHPNILRASAVVYDDSVILMQKEGVGFGVGVWGDQVVPWNLIDITERRHFGSSLNEFHFFTSAKKGRLISKPLSTTNHRNPNFCARDCLALPETKCLSINYNYGDFTCELLEEIEGHGVEIHESGQFTHYERLGVGHAVEFNHESLQLYHNQLYYFNIELLNYVGYENIISSNAIIADFTPPEPGLIMNKARDEVTHEPCVEFTPEEWERRCIEDTPLDNHRYIVDGPGSMTVFNGHEELVDMLYTRSNSFMAANWDGFHDSEVGIHGYTWSIGHNVCSNDVSEHIDPHAHLFDESEWTHQGLVTNVVLPDGAYYITVRALNKVEFGGPMALSVCHSTPLIIDNTPPIMYGIRDITYNSSAERIGMLVNATDPESHLREYHVAAGRTQRDKSLYGWEVYPVTEQLFVSFKIPNGVPCWMIVRAVNNVDLRKVKHAEEPILVDDSPPVAGDLFDGPYAGKDLAFTKDKNQICANWYNWYDPESGIFSYQLAFGTKPGLNNIMNYVALSRREHSACSGYVTLQHGETYYSTLVAIHGGYDKINTSASSNGVTADLTPPVQGTVYDGKLQGPTDVDFSSKPATVEAQWQGFFDPDSGIQDFEVTVYRKRDSSNTSSAFEVIHEAESVGSETSSIEWHHFHLKHKDQVYINLRTTNQAQNHIDTATDGFLIDLTPPVLRTLRDGLMDGQDTDFQSRTDSLAVHWDYFDEESGIESFELAIYELRYGNKHKIFPLDSNPNSFEVIRDTSRRSHVQRGLALRAGSLYITRVKAINQAKLVASHETSGIKVDPTPPVMKYVRGGNLDGEVEEVVHGYIYQNSRTTIVASWLAQDGQSGIRNYWVAVGTAPDSEDVQTFTSLGPKKSGVLSNLNLTLTNHSTCNNEMFTADCHPIYFVCVKTENGAGAFSDVACSSPIRVVEEDQKGYVMDGPSMLNDADAQKERTTVTIWFDDFESKLHGISRYEWAVGTTPGGEDIHPLTSDGIVPAGEADVKGLPGRGKAQSPVNLEHGVTYYSTLRAITNGGNVLETTSNGFRVDITPPEINITNYGQYDANRDLLFSGGSHLYQSNNDSIDATWNINEGESSVVATYFAVGHYPGGDDIFPVTPTHKSYIPSALIKPGNLGIPNILGIEAVNNVGLKRTVYTPSLTMDNTPPNVGQVHCPAFIHANSALLCSWSDFHDAESGISHYHFLIGSAQGLDEVFHSANLPGRLSHYSVKDLNLVHNQIYYVTVEAFNAVNQSTLAFSSPIKIDDTPPSYGVVVELSGLHALNSSDPLTTMNPTDWDCSDREECLNLDGECLVSTTQLQVLWQPFTDEDTRIIKYEVALGTTPGGSQIKAFYEVHGKQTSELIQNIDLSNVRQVYASVRGYNEAGLTSTAVSNGIYVSRFSAGLQPLRPFVAKDGIIDNSLQDMEFQTSLDELSAVWDFSGDPCPITKYRWGIYRIDGLEVQPLTDVGVQTSGTITDVEMTDGETYYSVVQASNALGLTVSIRSNGITIQRDPLIPGQVYDGLLVGFDLTYQKENDTISANWKGFGQGMPEKEFVEHTGNAGVPKHGTTEQTVDFYKVAVGTDRRYPKTRDNVVPFTYVGRNTTVTFKNLDLTAIDSTYYVTVRGYSASFATAEVTSTGINVGVESTVTPTEIEVRKYVNSLSDVQLSWSKFVSTFPILLYYVGIGELSPSSVPPWDIKCLDMLLDSKETQLMYNKRNMHFVGKDTYVEITGLSLKQEGHYYATIVGVNEAGQCNTSTSFFSVDITPPTEGRLRVGPFYDVPVMYTNKTESMSVVWENYQDKESGIEAFNMRIVEAATCNVEDGNTLTPIANQEWLVLGPNIQDFTFVDLNLAINHPYFVQLLAINNAGDSVQTQVGPIFVDSSEPTQGLVVDGPDFKMDVTDSADRHQVSATILHLANPAGPACPLQDTPFTDPMWNTLNFNGLWNVDRDEWHLQYQSAQVSTSAETLTLKVERDTRKPSMLTGAYITNAQVVRSSEYEFDLLAAASDLHSVTSILFWDGPDNAIGEFDFVGPENWQEGICQCCYAEPFNQLACPQCDCVHFLGLSDTMETNSTEINSTTESSASVEFTSAQETQGSSIVQVTTKLPRSWTIIKKNEAADSKRWVVQRACGIQLYPNASESQAVLWCRHHRDEWPMSSELVHLEFDPSQEEHHYSVHFRVMPLDAQEDEWCFEVYVDGKLLSSLTGIPVMSPSTKLILHVFNRDSIVADLEDVFNPPSSTATVKNLRMPPDKSELCRYGAPFRAGTSPVSRYFAGVGSRAGATDIAPYAEIARPCVPCINPCDRYQCQSSCSMDAVPITFTITNLTLYQAEHSSSTANPNANVTTNAAREDSGASPFFLTVKSVLANGNSISAPSSGFYFDDTPPMLDLFFHIDINVNNYEPTFFQSSASTISVLWSFIDTDSMVKENYWAIGTSRGATDLQDFVSVGLNQTGTNSNLTGLLHHNKTYYVTLKAINGAGLETLVECDGVTVLLEEPVADDVNTTSLFSQAFDQEVYPPEVEKSDDPTKTGTSWSKAEDESIASYEYCVSSSAELLDDIVPCMLVGVNSSGSVAIENGMVIVRAGSSEQRFNITDFQAPQKSTYNKEAKPAKFNMEPGKCLYTWMRMCNPANLCVTKSAGITTVLGSSDMMMTSANGTDVMLKSPLTNQRRRRRREVNSHFDFTVETTGGLVRGGSLIVGILDVNRSIQEFTSDANPDYRPYITNPLETIKDTSRLLRRRIRFVYEPTFYITSLGQTELQGPLLINFTLNAPGNLTEAKPRLIYWDTDKLEWRDAAKTCGNAGHITYSDWNQVSVEVCNTRHISPSSPAAGRKRRDALFVDSTYFSHETHFALAEVLNTIFNSPPEITNFDDNFEFYMDEDEGTLVYTFTASDAEDDILVFELAFHGNVLGSANISSDGYFSYTPCANCYGIVTLQISVREIQSIDEIKPLTTTVKFSIDVRPVNDNPVVYVAQDGHTVGNGRTAVLQVEQNTGFNGAYSDLIGELGAYDVDINDNLTLRIQPTTYGTLTVTDAMSTLNCTGPRHNAGEQTIPCGPNFPNNRMEISLTSSKFVYSPTINYHGWDRFRVLAEDRSGAVSQLLEVQIAVLVNPCTNNGTCQGPVNDPDCTSPARITGFESYFCICKPGWVGDFCQTNYDECQSTPCAYPYVCHDRLDGFECACPLTNPDCDSSVPSRTKKIIGITCALVGIFVIGAAIFCCIKKKHRKKVKIHPEFIPDDQQIVCQEIWGESTSPNQCFENVAYVSDTEDSADADIPPLRSFRESPPGAFGSNISQIRRSNAVGNASPTIMARSPESQRWAEPSPIPRGPDNHAGILSEERKEWEEARAPSYEMQLPGSLVTFKDDHLLQDDETVL